MTAPSTLENKQINWEVDDIPVYGTITCSKDEVAKTARVFVAGSGPTDKDWCSPLYLEKNGSCKLLAEILASQGFLTLRYDKRASGRMFKKIFPR